MIKFKTGIIILSTLSVFLSSCGDKEKTSVSSKTNLPKESYDECYSRSYKEISDENAQQLLKEGKYKNREEIPEQELVPQGLRMTLEEDCKERTK